MNNFQKSIKLIAITLAILIISSIINLMLFALNAVTDISKISSVKIDYSETFDNIQNINVNVNASKVYIKEGSTFKVDAAYNNLSVTTVNNTINIVEHKKIRSKNSNIINIYVPYKLDTLTIENGIGKLNIDNILAKDFKFIQGVGSLRINNSKFDNSSIHGGVGNIRINKSYLNDLNLDAGVGSVYIKGDITGNSIIENGIGEINLLLNNKDDYKIHSTKGIGKITVDDINQVNDSTYGNGINKIKIDGGIGSIKVKFNN